jgi:hypothetical protein
MLAFESKMTGVFGPERTVPLVNSDGLTVLLFTKMTDRHDQGGCQVSCSSSFTAVAITSASACRLFLLGGPMSFRFRGAVIMTAVLGAASTYSMGASSSPNQAAGSQRSGASPIPDRFVNLQVLPKDISKEQLVNIMKQLSVTFEVRCSHCHTVSDDLKDGRFDSDDKEVKRKTRELLRMIYESKR